MSGGKAIALIRGFARNSADEKRLRTAGVAKIYRGDNEFEAFGRWKMRRGEGLAVVDGFRAFGATRKAMMAGVRKVHAWGAVVVDAETGERSDRNGAEMLDRGLSKHASETRAPTPGQAREMQRRSVKARAAGAPDRVPAREAAYAWRHSPTSSNEQIAEQTGWAWRTLYNKYGPRGLPPGRRQKVAKRKKRI